MCRPAHFAVTYAINPWMDPESWARQGRVVAAASWKQWAALHRTLKDLGAVVELIAPVPELPDLVFTANAAVVLDGTALLARFRYPERQREEPHVELAFCGLQARGAIGAIRRLPDGFVLEGAGDCVWDATRNLFWMGYGQRSDARARHVVEETFGVEVVALELTDGRFYHLDTAFCALPGGEVAYFPGAFTAAAGASILERTRCEDVIEIDIEDALQLSANAVIVDDTIVLSGCSERLRAQFKDRGYRAIGTPLNSFLRSGGAAFCLTLRLDGRSNRSQRVTFQSIS